MEKHYQKFYAMLFISFVLMYIVMYLNTEKIEHVYFSVTRLYMTVLMITAMAVVMLLMMKQMYSNRRKNYAIVFSSLILFVLALLGVRNQTFVSDKEWMSAMIPHHSIAILTSKHANITDPEARRLADSIIKTQEKEIAQMKQMLRRMK